MIADLRKAEDDRLDDEMDMLRELDEPAEPQARKPSAKRKADDVLVEDSQALGPDGVADASEGEEEVQLGRDGKPLRVWKKKGLKRQTRKVNMKPRARRRSLERQKPDEDDSDAEDAAVMHGQVDAVAETQLPEAEGVAPSLEDAAGDSDFCDEVSDAEDEKLSPAKRRKTTVTNSEKPVPPPGEAAKPAGHDGFVQKTVKKISASAHANFRKLKIKSSKGAKAAQRGKFGRGRR